jgi:flagellar biosynthesis GTPase FlhF
MSSVRSVTLNDVAMPSPDTKTHIVIYHEKGDDALELLRSEIARLSALVEVLSTKVMQLESGAKTTPFFTAEVAPAPCGLDVWRISETPTTPVEAEDIPSKDVLQILIQKLPASSMDVEREQGHSRYDGSATDELQEEEVEEEQEEEVEEEQEEEEQEEEQEEEVEEEQKEEVEEEQEDDMEAEEEVVTFESFEFKGETYYKDPDGQVYQADADGDLNETPIGLWNEAKQKIQKYSKA